MSSLEVRAINKSFHAGKGEPVQVLSDLSFEAERGEFVVILGPSGCGKSTALRVIAGLERADSGDVLIDGRLVNDVPPAERGIAMVFQNYALFPHLTIAENIIFGLKVRRVRGRERERKLTRAAELLGLTDQLHKRPAELSGGQRQRVALGRALVSDSSLVLMDEPLSNLDAKLRQQMRLELRAIQRELGLTVVYVTHDQVEAMTMADRVVVLRDGRLEQVDRPRDLYRAPATSWVAGFIGSPPMNLLEVTRTVDGLTSAGQLVAPAEHVPDVAHGDYVLGIRPESITLDERRRTGVTGEISAVELLGSDTLVTLELGTGSSLTAKVPGTFEIEVGAAARATWGPEDMILYDGAEGHRIAENAAPPAEAKRGDSTSTQRK